MSRFEVRTLIALPLLLASAGFAAGGGDWEVNNGGSLTSRTVQTAYYKIDALGRACLGSDACRLTAKERELLGRIVASMNEEYRLQPAIRFESERKRPGFFLIDGEVKAAKTGGQVGAPIFFNSDMLYVRNFHGQVEAISFGDAVAQILHELGHHHGDHSHGELDVLGAKVALGTSSLLVNSPILPNSRAVNLQILNGVSESDFPGVYLQIYDDAFDLSAVVRENVRCPVLTVPALVRRVPDFDIWAPKATGAKFHNVRWEGFEEKKNEANFEVAFNVSARCHPKQVAVWQRESNVKIRFKVVRDPNAAKGWSLDRKIEVKQYREHWLKIFSLPLFF